MPLYTYRKNYFLSESNQLHAIKHDKWQEIETFYDTLLNSLTSSQVHLSKAQIRRK